MSFKFTIIHPQGLGGAFTAAVYEAHCAVIVGASGAIYGLVGAFLAVRKKKALSCP
jgi:membrane associated rhomboid family serine protease